MDYANDAYPTLTLGNLNSSLANFGDWGSLYSYTPFNPNGSPGLSLPQTYNAPAIYAAPTDSNTVGTSGNVSTTGQGTLDFWSTIGKRIVSGAVGLGEKYVNSQVATKQAQEAQKLYGSQQAQARYFQNTAQIIPGIPNIVAVAGFAFLAWKAVS